jgi:hypothetical protein
MVSLVAYAEDVKVFVTHPTYFEISRHAVRTYEKATGANLNPLKSKSLVAGGWSVPATIMGIIVCQQAKILGVMFETTVEISTKGAGPA